ncbi:MAG TPA: MgtC/SapB family protein [Blastocatellia bacterium]|nr:MgtC/SapB family protein [Blastocatellia bacterium]
MDFPLIDWWPIFSHLTRLAAAFLIALPVAWDREREARSAGLRTFPLVAIAAAGYILISRTVLGGSPESQARIIQGLITGIGFIGGGAILKDRGSVRGTATAASIWSTGAIGAAVAYDRYEIAIVLSLINFATLRWLTPLKSHLKNDEDDR